MVIESRVARMPVKVTMFTRSLLNQFRATLLGVLRIKMLPTAASADPSKQKKDYPSAINSLIHTPATTRIAPIAKLRCIPFLLISQLHGSANTGCAIVKSNALRVTSVLEILNLF